jgi:hypothetical protein
MNMVPGKYYKNLAMNLPAQFDNRWKNPGDISQFQGIGTTANFTDRIEELKASDKFVRDMSYCRLKTAGISVDLPLPLLQRIGLKEGKVYLEGQNLWTVRKGYAGDPSIIQSYMGIASASAVLFGLELKF